MNLLDRVALVIVGVAIVAGAVWIVQVSDAQAEGVGLSSASTPTSIAVDVSGSVAAPATAEPTREGVAGRPKTSTPDATWLARVSAATGIPPRALRAYASAQLTVVAEQPSCGLGWNTVAAIGAIESDHGRHGGAVLSDTGYPSPAIRGPALDGDGVAVIADTDGGREDGDTDWDRAVGPMQFIPDTWARWGADGDGDGVADPNQIDDAALATARYLCSSSAMTDAAGWRAAVFAYNHLDSYVDDIAAVANRYAAAAG